MNEVSMGPIRGLVRSARKLRLDVERLLAGLPFREADLDSSRRIDWDIFVEFTSRLQEAAGGLEGLRRIGRIHHEAYPEIAQLVGRSVSPLRFMRVFLGPGAQAAFPHFIAEWSEAPPSKARCTRRLPNRYRDCPGLFVLTEEAIRYGTWHIGLPPAEVKMDLQPRFAAYDIALPPPRSGAGIDEAAQTAMDAFEAEGAKVLAMFRQREKVDAEERLEQAVSAWSLTPRESEVLDNAVSGKSNKEIAAALECAESTVEIHMTHILRKSRARSGKELIAQFWSR